MIDKDFYYYKCVIAVSIPDEKTGKEKNKNEEYVIKAVSPTDVEAQMTTHMKDSVYDWSINSVTRTKIEAIIDDVV